MSDEYNRLDKKDILKEILLMVVKIIAFFAYWCFTLGIISMLLLSIWKVSWQQLVLLALVLTVITTVVHVISKIKNK